MSRILSQDNKLFALDTLSTLHYGLAVSKSSTGLDCRNVSTITGFTITNSQPANTDIRLAFGDGNSWFTLNTSGNAVSLSGNLDAPNILQSGNTVAQLKALSSIPAFVGKLIRVAVAMSTTDPNNSIPSVKLSLKVSAPSQQTAHTEFSPVYELGESAVITGIPFDTVLSGGATVSVNGKITRPDGSESDWLTPQQLQGANATAIQLKATYSVTAVSTGEASLTQAYITYNNSKFSAASGTGRIYTITEDWYSPVRTARINVRHSPLGTSAMKVYAAFRKAPTQIVREQLGISGSTRQTYALAHNGGIRYDTFRLYADSQEIYSGYELNCETGRVTLTAPEGSVITASYEYGWDKETWKECTLSSRYSLPDYDVSEYSFTADNSNASAGSVMIEITGQTGHVDNEVIATATGHIQTATLKKPATKITALKAGTSSANGDTVSSKNYSLMEDPKLLRFAAASGKVMRCSYDWASEPVQVLQVTAVFHN